MCSVCETRGMSQTQGHGTGGAAARRACLRTGPSLGDEVLSSRFAALPLKPHAPSLLEPLRQVKCVLRFSPLPASQVRSF